MGILLPIAEKADRHLESRRRQGAFPLLRQSPKADGAARIYTHGEKEYESRQRVLAEGIPVNEKTYAEMQMIAQYTGAADLLPEYLD